MKTTRFVVLVGAVLGLSLLSGCENKPKVEEPAVDLPQHVSENDIYIKSLDKEVKIDNPDSLIEGVNQAVGDNTDNAEKARLNAATAATHAPTAAELDASAKKSIENSQTAPR